MDPMKSPKTYPRKDNAWRTKSSMNFDAMRAKVFENAKFKKNYGQIWIANVLIGVSMGFIAFAINFIEDAIVIG